MTKSPLCITQISLPKHHNKRYKQQSDVEKLFGLQVSKNQICNPFQSFIRLRIHLEAGPPTVWVLSKFRDTAPLRMWLYQVMEVIIKLRGGVRVCGDAVLLDVWCVLRKFLF